MEQKRHSPGKYGDPSEGEVPGDLLKRPPRSEQAQTSGMTGPGPVSRAHRRMPQPRKGVQNEAYTCHQTPHFRGRYGDIKPQLLSPRFASAITWHKDKCSGVNPAYNGTFVPLHGYVLSALSSSMRIANHEFSIAGGEHSSSNSLPFDATFVSSKAFVLLASRSIMRVANQKDTRIGEEHMSSTRFAHRRFRATLKTLRVRIPPPIKNAFNIT